MNRGLISKSAREIRASLILFSLGLAAGMGALTAIVPQVEEGITDVLESLPFVRTIVSTLFGVDVEDEITAQMMQAFVWVHPVNLAMIWAAAIVWCTRVPCAEIDRGTIDLLLGWPVSRRQVALNEMVVCAAAGAVLIFIGSLGHLVVGAFVPPETRAEPLALARILTNLYAVYLAVAGLSWLCSCAMERRARAIGTVFAALLLSFLLNFIVQVWPEATPIGYASILHYYRPALIVRADAWPLAHLAVLLAVAGATWGAGSWVFSKRQIRTG